MRNKNKKEIDMIVEVLTTHAIADDSEHTDLTLYAEEFDKVATSILSKLKIETLDRGKIEKIITNLIKKLYNIDNGICEQITGRPIDDYVLNRKNAINEAITQICQLKPKNQVVIAEGRFIIDSGEQFGISQRACYIKLSPRKLIGIGALGRRLEEKGVEGKKVLIILEEVDENQRTI